MPETFDPTYYYPYKSVPQFETVVSSLRGGTEKRRALRSSDRRVFELGFGGVTDAQASYILTFFEARKGMLEAFNWTCPNTSVTYLVRFDSDEPPLQKTGHKKWSGSCRLVEVTA